MKNAILLILLGLAWAPVSAQKVKAATTRDVVIDELKNELKNGVIEVSGSAEKSVSPDQVIFNLNLNGEDLDFSKAVDNLNGQMSALKTALLDAGITPDKIKTMNYNVNENYKYENGKRTKKGYKATQSLQIKEVFEDQRLKEVHAAITGSGVEANMRISFGLNDVKKYRDELMVHALFDARAKATLLAQVENSKLGNVIKITYGQNSSNYRPRNYQYMDRASMNKSGAVDINPGDLNLTDQVHVVYEIIPLK